MQTILPIVVVGTFGAKPDISYRTERNKNMALFQQRYADSHGFLPLTIIKEVFEFQKIITVGVILTSLLVGEIMKTLRERRHYRENDRFP